MAGIRLLHVERFRDRHGRVRYYFRRGHGPRCALPGEPGSEEFMAAYAAALAKSPRVQGAPKAAGTFGALVQAYLRSTDFLRNSASTQAVTRSILERFAEKHGHRLVAQMKREHVDRIIASKAATPAAANNLLKKLRVVIRFAIARGWRETDPTVGFRKFKEGEHHTWSEAEIAKFEARWPLGTRERTAFALALYTGQRRSDLHRMTWTDIDGGKMRVVQVKGGTKLTIPMHPNLIDALAAWQRAHVTIITTSRGAQYTVESFGNMMADAIDAAGLPAKCVLHGLRKAAARRLAETGCTTHQIQSITGHKTLAEVERYTRAAAQEGLADAAIIKLRGGLGQSEKR